MRFLDYTCCHFAQNLALDEWLLARAESMLPGVATGQGEVLRLWRPQQYAVVVGRGSKWHEEVDAAFCQQQGISIFRRHSGGASVVTGPGCWMYAVVLDMEYRPNLRDLSRAHHFVMRRICDATQAIFLNPVAADSLPVDTPRSPDRTIPTFQVQGTCDLTVAGRKCSGNSLKVARRHLLYHGTLLVEFDLNLLSGCLRTPPRQPEYRQQRSHEAFVTNIPRSRFHHDTETLWQRWSQEMRKQWECETSESEFPGSRIELGPIQSLVEAKYQNPAWNFAR